jgi:3-hydroxymyristoyl/3-hydroxydecanoyl-(acyl carrier protein) dehydratase
VGPAGKALATGDLVSVRSDGRFELLGRADDVVKVGEKRVDLSRMASQLRAHAWVDAVSLTTLGRERETRVAAAIVPSEEGRHQIGAKGRSAFLRGLRAILFEAWDPVVHPRYWRIVPELPEDSRGKLRSDALRRLFEAPVSPEPVEDRPELVETDRGEGYIEQSCRVPELLSCLPGHFPGSPVVPGVLQLDWVLDLVAEFLGQPPRVATIESLKFRMPLVPGARIRIHVHAVSERGIEFGIRSEGGEHARGRLLLEAEAEEAP